jgi:hypothetical protein
MGLAERRAAETFRTEHFPGWKTKIDEAAGFDVPVEVGWDTLVAEGYAEQMPDFLPKIFFEPLAGALAAITIDDMGKEALRGALTKIVVKNSKQYYSASGFSFANGVLTVDHLTDTNVSDVEERRKNIQKMLEQSL